MNKKGSPPRGRIVVVSLVVQWVGHGRSFVLWVFNRMVN